MSRWWRLPVLGAWVLWHVVLSAVEVGGAAMSPGPASRPVLVRYPMRCRGAVEVTALAWAITVTPGTLVAVLGEEEIWVHVVLGGPREEMLELLAETEDRVLWALRPGRGDS